MLHSHYPLQALLYSVVLHRYLRWRLPGYDPERHLGGILYLYVRGMCGPETPEVDGQPCGVFAWHPPAAMVEELSDLLDGACGRGGGLMVDRLTCPSETLATAGSRWTPPACCAPSTRPTCSTRPTSTSPPGWARSLEETDEQVLLAAALAVRAVRAGSICLDLATVADLPLEPPRGRSAAVARAERLGRSRRRQPPWSREQMLRLVGTRLYLDRYWREEGQVCDDLVARIRRTPPEVDDAALEAGLRPRLPRRGVRRAARRRPGGRVPLDHGAHRRPRHRQDHHGGRAARAGLRAARARHRSPARIALAAPTGKAAARLQEAVQDSVAPTTAPSSTRATSNASSGSSPPPCTVCSAGGRTAASGSATTAATGCPTTSSWSTRRRWCR